jgi:hypothetical protein
MKKGMIFDLYQDGQPTRRVMAVSDLEVVDLNTMEVYRNIDFENEVGDILIQDIFLLSCSMGHADC